MDGVRAFVTIIANRTFIPELLNPENQGYSDLVDQIQNGVS